MFIFFSSLRGPMQIVVTAEGFVLLTVNVGSPLGGIWPARIGLDAA